MGTSGAFGGSDTKKWKIVRITLDQLLEPDVEPDPDREPDGDDDQPGDDGTDTPDLADLVSNIAQALISDDPRVRPGRHLSNSSPSPGVTSLLGQLGLGGGSRRRGGATTGRRSLGQGARSAGRAMYGGVAAARGDAAALGELGIALTDLAGKTWVEQVLLLTEAILGSSSDAEEHALRNAVVASLLTLDGDATREPLEVLRDVIAAYVTELALVELVAALTAREIDEEQAAAIETEVEQYIEVRRDGISLPEAELQTATDFEDAAELLMQEVLLILRAGGASS